VQYLGFGALLGRKGGGIRRSASENGESGGDVTQRANSFEETQGRVAGLRREHNNENPGCPPLGRALHHCGHLVGGKIENTTIGV